MKMFKKILIGILLFGVVAVLLLQIDDELDPDIATFLEQAKPAESSEAYLYLLGIEAAEGEDPLTVGQRLFASMQQAEEDRLGDESFRAEGYPEDKKLALPQGELFCNRKDVECWKTIFTNRHDIESALQDNGTLLNRYQTFMNMDDYASLVKPMMTEPHPPFAFLTKANTLVILKAINIGRTAQPKQGIKIIMSNILMLRQKLESADSLIGKMIYAAIISDLLDGLSLLNHQEHPILDGSLRLSSISLAERDFNIVMSREFAMNYDLFVSLDKNPNFFARKTFIESYIPSWSTRTIYKPNMSINEQYWFYKKVIAHSRLEQVNFTPEVLNKKEFLTSKFSSIRNPVGSILNDISNPYYGQYIARLFDLNAKIAIFNQTVNKETLPSDLGYIQNPYYEKGGTAFYSDDGKSICLTGPLDDDKNQRCLRMKL